MAKFMQENGQLKIDLVRSDAFKVYRQTILAKTLLESMDAMVKAGSLSREEAQTLIKAMDSNIVNLIATRGDPNERFVIQSSHILGYRFNHSVGLLVMALKDAWVRQKSRDPRQKRSKTEKKANLNLKLEKLLLIAYSPVEHHLGKLKRVGGQPCTPVHVSDPNNPYQCFVGYKLLRQKASSNEKVDRAQTPLAIDDWCPHRFRSSKTVMRYFMSGKNENRDE